MIVVRLNGGLGNQLFQYAAGYALASKNKKPLMLDLTSFTSHNVNLKQSYRNLDILDFGIEFSQALSSEALMRYREPFGIASKVNNFLQKRVLKKYYVDWHPQVLKKKGNVYLDGYYQSELYFHDVRDGISRQYKLGNFFQEEIKSIVERIHACVNPISLHIRRGDYITNPRANKIHNVCTKNYFYGGLDFLHSRLNNPTVFVFSDDIDWVKAEMNLPKSTVYVSELQQNSGERLRSSQEIYLMSLCQHNIISNSSFSWWGAYLNKFKDKIVIAPNLWSRSKIIRHKNILPAGWVGLPIDV